MGSESIQGEDDANTADTAFAVVAATTGPTSDRPAAFVSLFHVQADYCAHNAALNAGVARTEAGANTVTGMLLDRGSSDPTAMVRLCLPDCEEVLTVVR